MDYIQNVIRAEEEENPGISGALRDSFTEEKTLELRFEQSVGLWSALGEREKQGSMGDL